jgi:single-stranded-DNA-specific exonuclease
MMLPLKRWNVLNSNENFSVINVLLENRNLTLDHLQDFRLSEKLYDPFLLKDMDIAVERILTAIERKEKIVVFGDYDVDGIVSTVMMKKLFDKINYPVDYLFPNRHRDGYGLKLRGIEQAKKIGADLIITVDNGISSHEAIELASQNKIDVIITDHHLQEGDLPAALAIVNPNRKDCNYPFKGICGAGVVYKIFQALGPRIFDENTYREFMLANLDLVAMAIIADVAPIRDENYALLKFGLISLTRTTRPGITELKRVSGLLGKNITPTAIGFYLGPRLNAAGRLKEADIAAKLLLTRSREDAAHIAAELNQLNTKRQHMQELYLNEAIEIIESGDFKDDYIYFVDNKEWDLGIIGILSGKLKDRYNRPVMAFTCDDDGNYIGSARSIENFHITDALTRFSRLFMNYGGHAKAAGVTLLGSNYAKFKEVFREYVNALLSKKDLMPELTVDCMVQAHDLNKSLVDLIEQIGPYGEGNPYPVLALKNTKLTDIRLLSNGAHLKFFVQSGNKLFECVWWGKGNLKDHLHFGHIIDIAFRPEINFWNGSGKLQLVIEDVKPQQNNVI